MRCEADWRQDCHEFALPVQHHSNVEIGHEIFSTAIPIPSYLKKGSCLYWQNPNSEPFCRSNNQTIGRWEQLGIILLPSHCDPDELQFC